MIEATLIECRKTAGEFRVEGILADGACEVAIFSGENAVERAVIFAGTYYDTWTDPEGWGEFLNQKEAAKSNV